MNIKCKKRLTYGAILMFNLCTGLSYAIIFPTIWNYIHERLGGDASMLGVVISAYSLSSLFANPLIGWWSDRSLNTRVILLVTIFAEITGSILYFIGISVWILMLGRLIAGIGAGGGAAVLADITRTTVEEERTPVLSVVIASRQLGLIIGPAFDIFLSQCNFSLFSFPVDKFTSPGLFMAFLWFLLELTVFFAYYNLTDLKNDEDVEKLFENYSSVVTGNIPYGDLDNTSLDIGFTSSYPPYIGSTPTQEIPTTGMIASSSSQPNLQIEWLEDNAEKLSALKNEEIESINCQKLCISRHDNQKHAKKIISEEQRTRSISDRMIESAERLIQSTSCSYGSYVQENSDTPNHIDGSALRVSITNPNSPYASSGPPSFPDEKTSLIGHVRSDYLRDEIVVLLGLAFISCFAQTVLETVVTPLAQKYYNFTEVDNSYIYLFAGIEVILVFSVIKFVSRKVPDRALIVFGLFTLCVAMALPIVFVPHAVPGQTETLPFFTITVVIDLIGIAIIVVCSSSLLSKLINDDSQALFQGFRRSMCSLGCIMGPLWGGAFLFNIYFLFAIPLVVTALITLLFVISYKKLHVERQEF